MKLEMVDIVRKLIGPIDPVGETNTDNVRFENLKSMVSLVDKLLFDINKVAPSKNRAEYSMSRAGKFADVFLQEIRR